MINAIKIVPKSGADRDVAQLCTAALIIMGQMPESYVYDGTCTYPVIELNSLSELEALGVTEEWSEADTGTDSEGLPKQPDLLWHNVRNVFLRCPDTKLWITVIPRVPMSEAVSKDQPYATQLLNKINNKVDYLGVVQSGNDNWALPGSVEGGKVGDDYTFDVSNGLVNGVTDAIGVAQGLVDCYNCKGCPIGNVVLDGWGWQGDCAELIDLNEQTAPNVQVAFFQDCNISNSDIAWYENSTDVGSVVGMGCKAGCLFSFAQKDYTKFNLTDASAGVYTDGVYLSGGHNVENLNDADPISGITPLQILHNKNYLIACPQKRGGGIFMTHNRTATNRANNVNDSVCNAIACKVNDLFYDWACTKLNTYQVSEPVGGRLNFGIATAWQLELQNLIDNQLGAAISGIESIVVDDITPDVNGNVNNFAKSGCVFITINIRKRGKVECIQLCFEMTLTDTNTQ